MSGRDEERGAAPDRDHARREKKEKVEQTRATPVEDEEFTAWAGRQPKPRPDDPGKGNRLPPDPPQDLAAPREPGTAEPQGG